VKRDHQASQYAFQHQSHEQESDRLSYMKLTDELQMVHYNNNYAKVPDEFKSTLFYTAA